MRPHLLQFARKRQPISQHISYDRSTLFFIFLKMALILDIIKTPKRVEAMLTPARMFSLPYVIN
jgi:hypothetical protein